MDLDNEELEATRKLYGADKETELKKHIKNLKRYIEEDVIFQDPPQKFSDFDKYCYNHCLDIIAVLDELEKTNKEK